MGHGFKSNIKVIVRDPKKGNMSAILVGGINGAGNISSKNSKALI